MFLELDIIAIMFVSDLCVCVCVQSKAMLYIYIAKLHQLHTQENDHSI